jgi:hypothetical protein
MLSLLQWHSTGPFSHIGFATNFKIMVDCISMLLAGVILANTQQQPNDKTVNRPLNGLLLYDLQILRIWRVQ